jgi:hypothetical protein
MTMLGAEVENVKELPLGAVIVWEEKVLLAHNMLSDFATTPSGLWPWSCVCSCES